jgi:dihydroxyacid dehydratase/phosphogluconate dehydratase
VNDPVLESGDDGVDRLVTTAEGPAGQLPLDAEMLRTTSSGNLFGWTQNVAMGLSPSRLRSPEYLIISTQGGLRGPDGEAVALGYHTGHWEIGLLVEAAAREMSSFGAIPFAAAVSDPCDGRTNGTAGMLDSLPYRNDAAIVMRRLIRSLPTCPRR